MRPLLCAGHALYPQDMQGPELVLPMFEQARQLMARARLAADVAAQGQSGAGLGGESRIMPFARILQDGGVVLENLPLGRLRISLGRQTKAREGLRFAVWSGGARDAACYKGEIVLLHVRELDAVAEILHLEDAAVIPEPGDSLALLDGLPVLSPSDMENALEGISDVPGLGSEEKTPGSEPRTEQAAMGPGTACRAGEECVGRTPRPVPQRSGRSRGAQGDLHGHGDFLKRFAREREQCARFALVIARLAPSGARAGSEPERGMRKALELWRALLAPVRATAAEDAGRAEPFGGRYGSNSLIFFHPGRAAEDLLPVYAQLCEGLKKHGLATAAGLAGYPFLQFRKAEMQDCALKALEYALLLPEPRAGLCNSLALNISADRRYSLGDVFGAVEEYKLALLADEGNAMAWNSLGVCMAALGRQHEARRHFLEALKHSPDEARAAQICYNLGTVCQNLGERRARCPLLPPMR